MHPQKGNFLLCLLDLINDKRLCLQVKRMLRHLKAKKRFGRRAKNSYFNIKPVFSPEPITGLKED